MTQPPPPQQPPPQQPSGYDLAMAAAAAIATAVTVAGAVAVLGAIFAAAGIRRAALRSALTVVMGMPPEAEGFYGPATAQVARLNLMRRAQFLVASSRRFNEAMARIAAGGADPWEIFDVMAAERRYYGQHLDAGRNRMKAAAQADSAAMDYGALLGWYTKVDSRTSPECLAADRHNFRVDQMPSIGFPGAVHLHCRCFPGPPFPGAAVLTPARFGARGRPVPDRGHGRRAARAGQH